LLTSSLSMAAIDCFLSLLLVSCASLRILDPLGLTYVQIKQLQLSFETASRLRGLAQILPKTSPWKCQHVDTSPHKTKTIVRLLYRDTVDCLQTLLHHLQFTNSLDFCPYHAFTTAQCLVRIYGEWMSGDIAWNIQVSTFSWT